MASTTTTASAPAEQVDDVESGAGLDDLDPRDSLQLGPHGPHGEQADGVVAGVGVADADDPDPGHTRWMSRLRKCVAHEMHGS